MSLKSQIRIATRAAAAAACGLSMAAHAVDVDAGDYTTLSPGTNLGVAYYQHASRDSMRAKGKKIPLNGRLTSDIGILRGVHFTEIGGVIANPQFLLPFGRLEGQGDLAAWGSNTAAGDLILAAAFFGSQPSENSHFAVMPYVWLPTGQYDRTDPLSLGENRWKFALQAGYVTAITKNVLIDLVGDFTIFGRNTDANDGSGGSTVLKQKPAFDLQAHVRYQISPATDLRIQLAHVFGGETKLGDKWQENRLSTTRTKLGITHFFDPTTQILLSYQRDLKVKNGLEIDHGFQVRLLHAF